MYAFRAGPERAQDGDVGAFLGDHDHQRGHHVEHGHGHDQQHDDKHDRLLDLEGAEEIAVLAGPVARQVIRPQPGRHFAGHRRRGIEIVELQAQAGDLVARLVQLGGVIEVHQHQAAVVFVHVHPENADHGETPEARHETGGRHQRLRYHQRHRRTHGEIEFPRQRAADHDAEFART
jgi:hypothetical protein